MSISLFLCRVHVVLKYTLRHDKEEKFFPVITGAFWFNVVMQSTIYLVYIQFSGYGEATLLNTEVIKFVIVLFFFLSIAFFYLGIRKDEEYAKAESWFLGKKEGEKNLLRALSFLFMVSTFLGSLFSAIYQM